MPDAREPQSRINLELTIGIDETEGLMRVFNRWANGDITDDHTRGAAEHHLASIADRFRIIDTNNNAKSSS